MSQTLPVSADESAPPASPPAPTVTDEVGGGSSHGTAPLSAAIRADHLGAPVVEIVVPVYNEEGDLAASVQRLRTYLDESFPFSTLVTIVDNASTDRTLDIAHELASTIVGVQILHLDQKGRGRALRAAWMQSVAQVVAYMDVDLSTDLDALLPLVAPLLSGHSHLSIGSRLASGARVVRGPKREIISRCYNVILKSVLRNEFSDAQCGFKAIRRETAHRLLPLIEDDEWFFDTELLIAAERNGLRIHEVPVDWVEDPDSRVHIWQTVVGDLRGVRRLLGPRSIKKHRGAIGSPANRQWAPRDLTRYAGVGVVSTVAYFVLFLSLVDAVGVLSANVLALAACTAANMLATTRFTFGARSKFRFRHSLIAGVTFFVLNLAFTTAALVLFDVVGRSASSLRQELALAIGTGIAASVRFILLRSLASYGYHRSDAS